MLITDRAKLQLIKDALVHNKLSVTVNAQENLQLLEELLAEVVQELQVLDAPTDTEWILSASFYGNQQTFTSLVSAEKAYRQWVDGIHDYDEAVTASPEFSETITLMEHDVPTGLKIEIASKTIKYSQLV